MYILECMYSPCCEGLPDWLSIGSSVGEGGVSVGAKALLVGGAECTVGPVPILVGAHPCLVALCGLNYPTFSDLLVP